MLAKNYTQKSHYFTGTILVCSMCLFILATVPAPLCAEEATPAGQSQSAQVQSEKNDPADEGMISAGEILTVKRCIDIALRKNPTIVAAVNTVEVNRSLVGQARSVYYPQLSASATYNRIQPASSSTGTTPYNLAAGILSLNQYITDFGKTSSQVEISKYNLDSARSNMTNNARYGNSER